jgi:antirestriction protein ArdC
MSAAIHRTDIYSAVTTRMIAALERGVPWIQP